MKFDKHKSYKVAMTPQPLILLQELLAQCTFSLKDGDAWNRATLVANEAFLVLQEMGRQEKEEQDAKRTDD